MRNSKELKVKYHGNKEKPSRVKNPNVASMSKLGYRDDSPYNTLPYIDIHTPSGRIDMSGTGIPLWANGRILPPYSGVHQFDTTQVKEIPLAQDGQEVYNMERAKQLYTPDETGHWPSVDYETGEWLKSKVHPTAWMEYLYGYTLNPQQALNYDVRTNPEGYFGENTLQYVPKEKEGGPNNWLKKYQAENSLVTTTTRSGLSDEPPPAWRDAVYLPTVEISAPKTYKQKISEVMDAVPGYAAASMAGPLGILGHYAYNKALENLGDLDTVDGYNVPLEHVVNVATGISSDDLSQGDMKTHTESDALRMYLGLPQKNASFKPSKTNPNAYEINGYEQFFPERLDNLPSKGYMSWEGDPEYDVGDLKPWGDMVMGRHTVTSGQDEKGFYLEYKDVWDLDTYDIKVSDLLEKAGLNKYAIWDMLGQDTKNKKVSLGEIADKTIGKPFDIRGRIYYIKDPKTGKYVREDITSKKPSATKVKKTGGSWLNQYE